MDSKLLELRGQAVFLQSLAGDFINNIDEIAAELLIISKEAQKIQKIKRKFKAISRSLKEAMSDGSEDDESVARKPLVSTENRTTVPQKSADKPTVGRVIKNINYMKRFRERFTFGFRIMPARFKWAMPIQQPLKVVMATESRVSGLERVITLAFGEVCPNQDILSLIFLENDHLKEHFDSWPEKKGNFDVVKELVAYIFRAWADPRQFQFEDEIFEYTKRSRFCRFRLFSTVLIKESSKAEDEDQLFPLNLYLTGLSAMKLPDEDSHGYDNASNALAIIENAFQDISVQKMSKFLTFWSVSMVALFGRDLCPLRLAGVSWPSEKILLSRATTLTEEIYNSVVFAVQYLIAVRIQLKRGIRCRRRF